MANDDLTVVCAWCATLVRRGAGEHTSHGICANCAMDFLSRLPDEYRRAASHPEETAGAFGAQRAALRFSVADA